MMMIKNSGIVPGAVSNPFTAKKAEQIAENNNKTNAVKLDKISVPANKIDTIEISRKTVSARPSLSQTRDKITSDIKQDKDASFLDALREQINSNQYIVDSKELSKIMLTGINE